MKTLVKLVMLLAILAICMPAQGEILIYAKTVKCWDAEEDEPWDVDEFTIRGYLVLEITRDGDEVIVEEAGQIEYGRDGRDKWWDAYPEEFFCIRVENDEVEWVLAQAETDPGDEGEITMLRGKASDMDVGFGRNDRREVAKKLSGKCLTLWTGNGDWLAMCDWELRLKTSWTKKSNEDEDDFGDAMDRVIGWLENRGYEDGI